AKAQLAHLSDLFDRRIIMTGAPILLQPRAAQIIGMAIHELASNACKHGALATDDGTVHLTWKPPAETGETKDSVFHICWHEQGGTPLSSAMRKGFGSKITLDMPAKQLKANVSLEPRDDGLIWNL